MSTLSQEKIKQIVINEILKHGDTLGPNALVLGATQITCIAELIAQKIMDQKDE